MRLLSNFVFLFLTLCCVAQKEQIIPLDSILDIYAPNGSYLKDVKSVFPNYVGKWVFSDDFYEYTMEISEEKHVLHLYPNGDYHYDDKIFCEYIVRSTKSKIIVFSSSSLREPYNSYEGSLNKKDNSISIAFYDNNGGTLFVDILKNNNLDLINFEISKFQVDMCGEPKFNRENCILPHSKCVFKRVN